MNGEDIKAWRTIVEILKQTGYYKLCEVEITRIANLLIKIKETKKEVKDNEKWLKALVNEYCKRNNDETLRAIDIARIMIKHYRNILTEQQEMLKEIKKAYKNI